MKNINKNIDVMAEFKKMGDYREYAKDADFRVRLAVEVYNARKYSGLSQQELAKKIKSTQKIVSKIENADINAGSSLLNRIFEVLGIGSETLGKIFNRPIQVMFFEYTSGKSTEAIGDSKDE